MSEKAMKIFVSPNGSPLSFYMLPCKLKSTVTKLVQDHGGKMAATRREATISLYNPGDIVSDVSYVDRTFIKDCVTAAELLDVEKYRYKVRKTLEPSAEKNTSIDPGLIFSDKESKSKGPNSTASQSNSRSEYTIGEDVAIIQAVLLESKYHSVNGNKLWQMLAARKVVLRSAQSMKERFIKKILPYVENYDLTDLEIKKLKTLVSAKTLSVSAVTRTRGKREELPLLTAPANDPYDVSDAESPAPTHPSTKLASKTFAQRKTVPNKQGELPVIELSSGSEPCSQTSTDSLQSPERIVGISNRKRQKPSSSDSDSDLELLSAIKTSKTRNTVAAKVARKLHEGKSASAVNKDLKLTEVLEQSESLATPQETTTPQTQPAHSKESVKGTVNKYDAETDDDVSIDSADPPAGNSSQGFPMTHPFTVSEENGLPSQHQDELPDVFVVPDKSVGSPSVDSTDEEITSTQPFTVSTDLTLPSKWQQDALSELAVDEDAQTAAHTGSQPGDGVVQTRLLCIKDSATPVTLSQSSTETKVSNSLLSDNGAPSSRQSGGDSSSVPAAVEQSTQANSEVKNSANEMIGAGDFCTAASNMPQCSTQYSSQYVAPDEHFKATIPAAEPWSASDSPDNVWPSPVLSPEEDGDNVDSCPQPVSFTSPSKPAIETEKDALLGVMSHEESNHGKTTPDCLAPPAGDAHLMAPETSPTVNASSSRADSVQLSDTGSRGKVIKGGEPTETPTKPSAGKGAGNSQSSSASSQLTWSTLDLNSQQCKMLSPEVNAEQPKSNRVCSSGTNPNNLLPIVCLVDVVKNPPWFSANAQDVTDRSVSLSGDQLSHRPSPEVAEQAQQNASSQEVRSSQEIVFLTSISSIDDQEVINSLVAMNSTGSSRGNDVIVSESSTDDEVLATQQPAIPGSPKRPSRLRELIRQPLKSERRKADSSVCASHSSTASRYEDCQVAPDSDPESEASYKSVRSQLDIKTATTESSAERCAHGKPLQECYSEIEVKNKVLGVELAANRSSCTRCLPNMQNNWLCHYDDLRQDPNYIQLKVAHGVEDKYMFAYTCGLSADWQLIEQHIITNGEIGRLWTKGDDEKLLNPAHRKKNMKELRRMFCAREIKSRKQFLLKRADINVGQRLQLLNMK